MQHSTRLYTQSFPVLAALCLQLFACSQEAKVCDELVPTEANLSGEEYSYIIDSIEIPSSASRASELAMDLNGDMRADNALGGILAAFQNVGDYDLSEESSQMIRSGALLQQIKVKTSSLEMAEGASVKVSLALDLDNDPSDNFDGSELFAVDPSVAEGLITGAIKEGKLSVDLGSAPLAVTFPGLDEPFFLKLSAAHIEADITADGISGRIGGAISLEDVHESLVPALTEGLSRVVIRDCPDNLCVRDSLGEVALGWFDEDKDFQLTEEELENSNFFHAILGPDLDLYSGSDAIDPNCDEENESLSLALGFTAIRTGLAQE